MSYRRVLEDGAGVPVPDGTYENTFRLYDVAAGGTALWTETQTLPVTDAVINAHPGDVVPLTTLGFDVPCWPGISIGADPELAPRVRLTTGHFDIDFYWTAAASAKDAVARAEIALPDPEEDRRIGAARTSRRG